jgi:hypothetical protein
MSEHIDIVTESEPKKVQREHWHIGKEIPIMLIFAILIQTAGGIWWAATLTNKLDNLVTQLSDIKQESYSKIDAAKDIELMNFKISDLSNRLNRLEK